MGKHWYTNGVIQIQREECPEGFRPGRLPVSDETRRKHSENNAWRNMTQNQIDAMIKKRCETVYNRSEEEKLAFSKKVSQARKGKGVGIEPWNKGKKGLQEAWNKGISPSEEVKEKIRKTKQNKSDEEKAAIEAKRRASRTYGEPWNKGKKMSDEQKLKISQTLLNKSPEEKQAIMEKQYNTKRQNNTFKTSEDEEIFYEKLLKVFTADDIIRQYKESRYPFRCDFYIKSLDVFIELNFTWTHGFKPFEGTEQDLELLEYWQKRSLELDSKFYEDAINTWTKRDVRKFKTANKNKLKYLVYYSEDESNSFEEDIKNLCAK